MTEILLIHGSCHGAWCWRDLLPELAALGHDAHAIDLPSHGDDPTPLGEVTLDAYAQAILSAIRGKALVVGHSMGGFPITRAAALDPSRIAGLVYLCAYMPEAGKSLVDMRKAGPRQPLQGALDIAEDGQSFRFRQDRIADVLYHDCPPETLTYAATRLCAQAVLPQATPIDGLEIAEALPRDYIVCAEDRTIPPEYQADMAARLPVAQRHRLDTSHSPFFANPQALAALLDRIAAERTVNQS